ncbi:hypothetical protein N9903_00500 [bacterium]|jgi:hypothetical protein|nr:hypothetical protein [bacterium]
MDLATEVKTRILADDTVIPLNDFAQLYMGNILRATVASLGHSGEKIYLKVENQRLDLYADGASVPIKDRFKRDLVESTVKGALSSLKGIVWFDKVIIISSG